MLIIQYSARSAWLSVRLSKWVCPKISCGQSNLDVDRWFNRIRHMAAMRPPMKAHWCHQANMIELVHPSAQSTTQTSNRSVQPFLHSSGQKVPIFYNGCPYPQNFPFPWGDLIPHLTHDSLGPCEPITQTAPRSVQQFLHR